MFKQPKAPMATVVQPAAAAPTEADIAKEAATIERNKAKKGKRKTSTASTVLSGAGNTLG